MVDPKVRELAAAFVDDLLDEAGRMDAELRTSLVDRAAQAMQQAIEQEVEAIRQELTT